MTPLASEVSDQIYNRAHDYRSLLLEMRRDAALRSVLLRQEERPLLIMVQQVQSEKCCTPLAKGSSGPPAGKGSLVLAVSRTQASRAVPQEFVDVQAVLCSGRKSPAGSRSDTSGESGSQVSLRSDVRAVRGDFGSPGRWLCDLRFASKESASACRSRSHMLSRQAHVWSVYSRPSLLSLQRQAVSTGVDRSACTAAEGISRSDGDFR